MKKVVLLSAVFMILFFSAKANAEANWIWVCSDEYVSVWVDNNSIGRDNYGFHAYFLYTYSEAGINRELEKFHALGIPSSKFRDLAYDIEFRYFKNSNGIKYTALMNVTWYNEKGAVLGEDSGDVLEWDKVIPSTIGEKVYDTTYARVRGK